MRIIYSIGIWIYKLGVLVASLWMEKARQMRQGWRSSSRDGACPVSTASWPSGEETGQAPSLHVAWFHASSLGEFEQARPVMEQFRRENPEYKILLTFFSPSGYEVRKNYEGADWVRYLPMDTPRAARRFVREVNPSVVFFVKYDFFFNYLRELKGRGVPTYIFSAIFRPSHYFFQWYGKWFLRQLHCYTHLFVQNEESLQLLQSHGIRHCSLAGDTRFDRVEQIAQQAKRYPEIEAFIGDSPVLMAGSSWPPDETNIKHFLAHYKGPLKLILAPHLIDEAHLQQIENLFGKETCVRYSQLSTVHSQQSILIIDNFGMLSSLYRYATVAYVGGAFGHGLHNILEALTFGKPVVFGPKYQKFQEAKDILARGGGFTYTDPDALAERLTLWLTNETAYQEASRASRAYVEENLGSTQKIMAQAQADCHTQGSRSLRSLILILSLSLSILLASCSVDKYVGEQDRLLRHNRYSIEMPDGGPAPKEVAEVLAAKKSYTVQKPNVSLLGVRLAMRLYCLSNPADSGALNSYLRRQGEAPVVYSPVEAHRTAAQLQSLLESKGCFTSRVTFDTSNLKGHDMEVVYHIQPSPRYRIGEVTYTAETDEVAAQLRKWRTESLLREGEAYDQERVVAERTRLASRLRNDGFYLATKECITFQLDTANDDHTLNIRVLVSNPRQRDSEGRIVALPFQRHHIDHIYFYPYGNTSEREPQLTYQYDFRGRKTDFQFFDHDSLYLAPAVIARNMFLFHGQPYRDRWVDQTYNALFNLKAFRHINIEFTPSPLSTPDSALLDAHVRLLPAKKRRLSLSMEVNNSSAMQDIASTRGNFGLEATLSYQNKNLFRRHSGLLSVDLSGLLELPKNIFASTQERDISAFELGTSATLDLPTLLLAPRRDRVWQTLRPHTLFALGFNYQYRPYFERLLANTSFGYTWNDRRSKHQLLPVEITFAHFFDMDPDYYNQRTGNSTNSRMKYQLEDHFIVDARYNYTYTTQQVGQRRDYTYLNLSVESAGNLLYGLSALLPLGQDSLGVRQLFGVPFSQYVRLDGEVKRYHYHGQRSTLVGRLLLGLGLPYGNSRGMQMPYEKSFFGGGPTTLRAWHLRQLGPGLSQRDSARVERTGDITLVFNLEERFPLAKHLEGALFADVGNVWLLYPNENLPGGEFRWRQLLPSLAVGTGFGLRANISILTLRLDVGLPILDPGYPEGERFRLPRWNRDHYPWSIRNLYFGPMTLNFGIDYPF